MAKKVKSIVSFLGYFFVITHLHAMMWGKLDVYWLHTLLKGGMFYYILMAAPFILIIEHAIAGGLDDAEELSPKTALTMALVSAIVLTVIQIIMRVKFSYYDFLMNENLWPNVNTIKLDKTFIILWNLRAIFVGVLAYSVYSTFINGVGFEYVEITSSFTDSGFEYDTQVSDVKHGVIGFILLGVISMTASLVIAQTPLIILVALASLLLLLKHKSKKAFITKLVAFLIAGVLSLSPILVYATGFSFENFTFFKFYQSYDSNRNFNGLIINGTKNSTIEVIKIPDKYFGIEVVEIEQNAFYKNYESLTGVIIPVTVKIIDSNAVPSGVSVFYEGTREDYKLVSGKGKRDIVYYYAEVKPENKGNYWHYDSNGKTPIKWEY